MKQIWYIHGANATAISFNYLKTQLEKHDAVDILYDASEPLEDTISDLALRITKPIHIIAHSLGGIIAVALSQIKPELVESVITMSTPFGGSEAATRMAMFMPFDPFLKNIYTLNPILTSISRNGAVVPTMTVVTRGGDSMMENGPNDGVVTVSSQERLNNRAMQTMQVDMNVNHFEVLLHPDTAEMIGMFHSKVEADMLIQKAQAA